MKSNIIEIVLPPDKKEHLEKIAARQGMTLKEWMLHLTETAEPPIADQPEEKEAA